MRPRAHTRPGTGHRDDPNRPQVGPMKNDFVIAIAQLSAEKNLDAETVYAAV